MGTLDTTPLDMPPVTDDHRRRAFVLLAMTCTSFEAAMADSFRRRVIECCAASLRTQDWKATQRRCAVMVKRVHLDEHGQPDYWVTQRASRNYETIVQPDLLDS